MKSLSLKLVFFFIFSIDLSLLNLVAAFAINDERADVALVTLKSSVNQSLCVRTESYELDGGIMRLADCEKEYMFYNGDKSFTLMTEETEEGYQMETDWAMTEDSFSIWACIATNATGSEGSGTTIRTKYPCEVGDSMQKWDFPIIDETAKLYSWKHISQGNCVRAPEIADGVILETAPCDIEDVNQVWLVEGY